MHQRGDLDLAAVQLDQALAVLRAGGAPYYVVRPALDAAELQLARDRLEEAADLLHEGAAIAAELGLKEESARAERLKEKLVSEKEDARNSRAR
jgi:hypothetical protein